MLVKKLYCSFSFCTCTCLLLLLLWRFGRRCPRLARLLFVHFVDYRGKSSDGLCQGLDLVQHCTVCWLLPLCRLSCRVLVLASSGVARFVPAFDGSLPVGRTFRCLWSRSVVLSFCRVSSHFCPFTVSPACRVIWAMYWVVHQVALFLFGLLVVRILVLTCFALVEVVSLFSVQAVVTGVNGKMFVFEFFSFFLFFSTTNGEG